MFQVCQVAYVMRLKWDFSGFCVGLLYGISQTEDGSLWDNGSLLCRLSDFFMFIIIKITDGH